MHGTTTFAAMAAAPPPPHPIVSSTPSLRWPLRDPSRSMPPMHYLRMEELTELRRKSAAASAQQQTQCNDWMNDVPGAISTLFNEDEDCSQLRHDYTILSLSILLLGHGYADEAHALVTPYSWPEEIYTSYGPVRYGDSDPGVVSVATYVHSLVHRKEGWNVGEFGMTGWSNADYWGNAWSRPFLQQENLQNIWRGTIAGIQNDIRKFAEDHPRGKEWCSRHLSELLHDGSSDALRWDPRALHALCSQLTKSRDDVDKDLLTFAEKAVEAELRGLLSHCVKLAGYSTK